MAFKDIVAVQQSGMRAMATNGVIGLHLVSGPVVGFAIGYGLDAWLGTGPWFKLIFFLTGILAGFLNVWRDTKELLAKMEKEKRYPEKALVETDLPATGRSALEKRHQPRGNPAAFAQPDPACGGPDPAWGHNIHCLAMAFLGRMRLCRHDMDFIQLGRFFSAGGHWFIQCRVFANSHFTVWNQTFTAGRAFIYCLAVFFRPGRRNSGWSCNRNHPGPGEFYILHAQRRMIFS